MARSLAPSANLRRAGNAAGYCGLWRDLGSTLYVRPRTLEAVPEKLEAIPGTLYVIRPTLEANCTPLEAVFAPLEVVCAPLEAVMNRFRSFEAPARPSQEG